MSIPANKFPSPNPKYPFVGEAYQRHGEVTGYVYDPYSDKYYIDPKALKDQQIQAGYRDPDPKPAGFLDTYAPVIGGVAAAEAAKGLGAKIPGMFGSVFGSGTPTAAAASTAATTGASTVATPTLVGATDLATGVTAAPASGGMLSVAAPVLGAAALAGGMYNYGGREILNGKADAGNVLDTALQSNLMTGWINPVLDVVGLGTVGGLLGLGHKSTKQARAERDNKLAKVDPAYASFLEASKGNKEIVSANIEKGKASTPDGFKGFWDDPATQQDDKIWINKQAPTEGFKHNQEYFNTLGSGDVMNMPWLYENVPGYGNLSFEQKAQIADAALQSGTAKGNKGNIDFQSTEDFKKKVNSILGVK
jgi:hypothetical protein